MVQLNLLVSSWFATHLPAGTVSYLFYADRLVQLPLGIVGVALGTALLPALSLAVREGRVAHGRPQPCGRARRCCWRCRPRSGLVLLAQPIVHVLFERGAFGADATTGDRAGAGRRWRWACRPRCWPRCWRRDSYAREDTRTPVRVAAVALGVNVAAALLLTGPLGHVGIALALSLSSWVNALGLGWLLWRRGLLRPDAACAGAALAIARRGRWSWRRCCWRGRGQSRRAEGTVAVGAADRRPAACVTWLAAWGMRCRRPRPASAAAARRPRLTLAAAAVPKARSPRPREPIHAGPHLLRHPADLRHPPRQLSGRDPPLGAAAVGLRVHLLPGRPACADHAAGPRARCAPTPARRRRPCIAAGVDPQRSILFVQSNVPAHAQLAWVLELRQPAGLAQPDDPVQGEGRQGPRERAGRPVHLSGPDGGRHPGLPGDPRAGRRGPEAASGAGSRHRRLVQPPLRRRAVPAARADDPGRGHARHVACATAPRRCRSRTRPSSRAST